MSGTLKLYLKPNERIFVNGAVLRVDRKVAIELLNDVVFLLESHVMQAGDADTPLKQLYFIVQSMLTEPGTKEMAHTLFEGLYRPLLQSFRNQDILEALVETRSLVDRGRPFDALKLLRRLFPTEQSIIDRGKVSGTDTSAVA